MRNEESSMFGSFYRLPRELFMDEEYSNLKADAKLLYSMILDRMCLSASNGWFDKDGRVYQYFAQKDAALLLGCCLNKACGLFAELENAGLIERRRQGLCKASVIYLSKYEERFMKSVNRNHKIWESGIAFSGNQDSQNLGINYTEYNQNKRSYTESSIIEVDEIEEQIKLSMEYDVLEERVNKDLLDEIVSLMTELMCITSPIIRIGRCEHPRSLVHSRIMSLRCEHIEYVLDCMENNSARIRDIKSYLISALFNAPSTMNNYYKAEVNADFA